MKDGFGNKPKSIWQLQIVCIISGFWGCGGFPQTLTVAPALDPAGGPPAGSRAGLPSPEPPVPTLTSEPGYATAGNNKSFRNQSSYNGSTRGCPSPRTSTRLFPCLVGRTWLWHKIYKFPVKFHTECTYAGPTEHCNNDMSSFNCLLADFLLQLYIANSNTETDFIKTKNMDISRRGLDVAITRSSAMNN